MVITSLRCSVGGYYIQEVQVNGLEKIVIIQCRRPYVDNIIRAHAWYHNILPTLFLPCQKKIVIQKNGIYILPAKMGLH